MAGERIKRKPVEPGRATCRLRSAAPGPSSTTRDERDRRLRPADEQGDRGPDHDGQEEGDPACVSGDAVEAPRVAM